MVTPATDRIPVRKADALCWGGVPVDREWRVSLRGAAVDVERTRAGSGDDAPRVELQRGDRVAVADGLDRVAGAQVPDPDRLVERARDDICVVELERGHRRRVAHQRAMRLSGTHCQPSTHSPTCGRRRPQSPMQAHSPRTGRRRQSLYTSPSCRLHTAAQRTRTGRCTSPHWYQAHRAPLPSAPCWRAPRECPS